MTGGPPGDNPEAWGEECVFPPLLWTMCLSLLRSRGLYLHFVQPWSKSYTFQRHFAVFIRLPRQQFCLRSCLCLHVWNRACLVHTWVMKEGVPATPSLGIQFFNFTYLFFFFFETGSYYGAQPDL
jgi:hypothetical protein